MTRAVAITGGPGTGKSSVAQAFTTLLENAGIEHGAIESEQLAWGSPWLPDRLVHGVIPRPPGVDLVLDTDGRRAEDVAEDPVRGVRQRRWVGR